jgi:uncharacterized repeat protein (TIGR02543 family)
MKAINVFLIIVALVVGTMGCGSAPDTDAPLLYTLEIRSTAGGSVTVTIDGEDTVVGPGQTDVISDIPAGTEVALAATPGEEYEFVEWLGEPIDGAANSATTIDMQDDCEITAVFQELIPVPIYELTMAASPLDGGTATDETTAGPYAAGAAVSIKAVASQGYGFVNWTAPAGEFGNPNETETTFSMPPQAVTVTANFEEIPL